MVLSSGRLFFYVRYLDRYSKTSEKRFADARVLSLSDARFRAKELLARLSLGEDPFAEKLLRKQVPTYKEFIDSQYLPYIKINKKSWTVDEAALRLQIGRASCREGESM